MANYFIIGGDGKEYGPVTEADVRQWIAEGRLNGISQAKAESDAEFRPLAQFPEFASALSSNVPPPSITPPSLGGLTQNPDRAAALDAVKVPAICLMIVGVLSFVLSIWGLLRLVVMRDRINEEISKVMSQMNQLSQADAEQVRKMVEMIYGPIGVGAMVFMMIVAVIVFWGARKMRQLKNFELCFVAAILVMVPCLTHCCAWIFGLPIGIWVLVVLNRAVVKSQFK